MGTPLTDEAVALWCRLAIARGMFLTAFAYRLRGRGYAISEERLRRIWVEQGGAVRPKSMLYAPGTGPTDGLRAERRKVYP